MPVPVALEGVARRPGATSVGARVEVDGRVLAREVLVLEHVEGAAQLREVVRRQRAVVSERQHVGPGGTAVLGAGDGMQAVLHHVREQRAAAEVGHHEEFGPRRKRASRHERTGAIAARHQHPAGLECGGVDDPGRVDGEKPVLRVFEVDGQGEVRAGVLATRIRPARVSAILGRPPVGARPSIGHRPPRIGTVGYRCVSAGTCGDVQQTAARLRRAGGGASQEQERRKRGRNLPGKDVDARGARTHPGNL